MTTRLINQGGSLSLQLQLAEFRFNHGIFILLFCLFPLPFAHSQPLNVPPPGTQTYQKVKPSWGVVMIALVSSFVVMGFFSVYIRRCSRRRSGGRILNPAAADTVLDVGRRSRRAPLGLDKDVIETFPTFLYSAVKGLKIGKGSLECAVCLNEFEDGDTLRLIPQCSHVFHPDCVGEWLASHTTCPVCRANLVPRPGDVALSSVLGVEPDNISLQENQQSNATDQTGDEVVIRVANNNTNQDRESEAAQTQFSDANLLNPLQKNRPPRSWSTGWQLGRLFPRSHTTGHSLVRPGENCERFTLRLPEELRSQLMNAHLYRAQSCVAFPRVSSSRRGYRNRSSGYGRSSNYYHYERFDREGQPSPRGRAISPPFIARTGPIRSYKGAGGTGSDEVNATALKRFSRSISSPLDRSFSGTDIGGEENDDRRVD